MNKFNNFLRKKAVVSTLGSLISIAIGLLVGLILMFVFNPQNALSGFAIMLKGGLADGLRGVGNVLYYMAPYLMLGLSVAFSFQTGVFNIGVTGQYMVGSCVGVLIGGLFGWPWYVILLICGLCGMLWAFIPGVLKAKLNVNEIITCIMMNYIAMYLCNQLVKKLYYDKSLVGTGYSQASALMPKAGLNEIFQGSSASLSIVVAICMAILVYVILYKTTFGFELRSCGFNPFASQYVGINQTRNVILMMLIAGFIAGMGGGMHMLSSSTKYYKYSEAFIAETNYAIPVSLLASNNPIAVIFSALFVAWLTVGGSIMQGKGFPVETVNMITGIILYVSAFAFLLRGKIAQALLSKSEKQNKDGGER
ncbi:MAG: ABC transporter permease [Oscillospiraceae bacterium]|nr:ABC transporter permease [Oscillospiraceae bacterium]